jgi:hypothetical protein
MCVVDGCGSPVQYRGLCSRHYNAWRISADFNDFEGLRRSEPEHDYARSVVNSLKGRPQADVAGYCDAIRARRGLDVDQLGRMLDDMATAASKDLDAANAVHLDVECPICGRWFVPLPPPGGYGRYSVTCSEYCEERRKVYARREWQRNWQRNRRRDAA